MLIWQIFGRKMIFQTALDANDNNIMSELRQNIDWEHIWWVTMMMTSSTTQKRSDGK